MSTPESITQPLPRVSRPYYGWVVLVVAAAAMVGTLPGRTQGLGLVTEPLIAELGIDRVRFAHLNFWSTLLGAAGAVGVGRLLDRLGARSVIVGVALALGVVVCVMSQVTSFAGLAATLFLTRAIGQSALSVVSIAMVGHWFVRRINTAMAVYTVVLSVGFMAAFPTVGAVVQQNGWRTAWLGVGLALVAGLAPLAWIVVRRGPEAIGLAADGDAIAPSGAARHGAGTTALAGHTWSEALATPAFWVFAIGAALYGLVASGIGLFNESILAERGFGPDVYYQSLVVTAMTALAGNFFGGWLAGRVRLGTLLAVALGVLTGGLAALPFVITLAHVMLWATAMGLGGGLVTVLFFSVWPHVFGRRHLGRIQGAAQALTVLASALGPVLLAWCVTWTGSYSAVFEILAGVTALVALSGLVVSIPVQAPAASDSAADGTSAA